MSATVARRAAVSLVGVLVGLVAGVVIGVSVAPPAHTAPVGDTTVCGYDGHGRWVSAYSRTYGASCAWPEPAPLITPVAPRLFGTGDLDEDQSPYVGAYGGALVSYGADHGGIACYSDGSATDGHRWFVMISGECVR